MSRITQLRELPSAAPQPEKPKPGVLRGKQNVYWSEGSKQPRFRGTFTLPNNAEPRAFSLWVDKSREKGNIYLSGSGSDTATNALDKMANKTPPLTDEQKLELTQHTADGFAVKPHQIVLFQAKNADPSNNQPGLYGYYNPADGSPLHRFDVWMRPAGGDRYELSGNTSEYDFDKHLERLKAREAEQSAAPPEAAAEPPNTDNGDEDQEDEQPTRKRTHRR